MQHVQSDRQQNIKNETLSTRSLQVFPNLNYPIHNWCLLFTLFACKIKLNSLTVSNKFCKRWYRYQTLQFHFCRNIACFSHNWNVWDLLSMEHTNSLVANLWSLKLLKTPKMGKYGDAENCIKFQRMDTHLQPRMSKFQYATYLGLLMLKFPCARSQSPVPLSTTHSPV